LLPRKSSTVRPTLPASRLGTPRIFFASMVSVPRILSVVPPSSSVNELMPWQVTASVKAWVTIRHSHVQFA
jgi:hypothetical protein